MPYIIDGHNLIHYLDDIQLDDPHDEAKLALKLRGSHVWAFYLSRAEPALARR